MDSSSNGYNPLRWNCDERGCFNIKKRPKLEVFAAYLPGKIALSDVDATVEIGGSFLFLEWKAGEPRELSVGQRLYAERLTALSPKITYIVVFGDAEAMTCTHIQVVHDGTTQWFQECDITHLKNRIRSWSGAAQAAKVGV